MTRVLLILGLIGLCACSLQEEEVVVPVDPEPVSEGPGFDPTDPCADPGSDDGIGGTGCPVD